MKIELTVTPLGTNNLYANVGRKRFLTPKARDNKEAIAKEAGTQFRGSLLAGPLVVEVDLYWPTRANHDVDNIKILLDSLTGVVWVDDGQIVDLRTRKHYRKNEPGVLLEIREA